jgi:Na+-transporting NADH:ubiquinone oxidoreductase subunit NqrC
MKKLIASFLLLGVFAFFEEAQAQRKVLTKQKGINIQYQEEVRIAQCETEYKKKIYKHRITVYLVNENTKEVVFDKPLTAKAPADFKFTGKKGSCWNQEDRGTWKDIYKVAGSSETTILVKEVLSDNPNTAGKPTCLIPAFK